MAAFVDTSGILKLYVSESGSAWMDAVVVPQGIIISAITFAEVGSSLSRRVRDGTLTPRLARIAWTEFRREARGFLKMPVPLPSLRGAARLTARSAEPLRALDAIQLQSALEAAADARRKHAPVPIFVSADERLLRAAATAGFATDSPLDHASGPGGVN